MTKSIVLCADDYGQAPSISEAIIELLSLDRLSATSCMTNASDWSAHAKWLHPFKTTKDIGLHFNLTQGMPLSSEFRTLYGNRFFSLSRLLMRAYAGALDKSVILAECLAQIAAFQAEMGCSPDFIDGHQHVHQFPIVRDALLMAYQQMGAQKPYIRLPALQWRIPEWKKMVIACTGMKALGALLRQSNIPHNSSFSGSYDFASLEDYGRLFPHFLTEIEDRGIIMCHPGKNRENAGDPIAPARVKEWAYFKSDLFLADCEAHSITVSVFKD